MRVAVMAGGANTERDVSLASGAEVARALREQGHAVAVVDSAVSPDPAPEAAFTTGADGSAVEVGAEPPALEEVRALREGDEPRVLAEGVLETCAAADLVIILLYGDEGESGHVQCVLDLAGIRYAGPSPRTLAVTFDKDITKRVAHGAGIPTAPWEVVHRSRRDDDLAELGPPGPWVVKPVAGGSTVGASLAGGREDLSQALATAFRHGDEALVESFLDGREVSVSVLGDRLLPIVELRTSSELFDYADKYQDDGGEEIVPAPIPGEERERIEATTWDVVDVLRLGRRSWVRVDLRADADGTYHLLEVNPLPGMTATSIYPRAAAAAGLELPALCQAIVELETGGS
jgi:D-alanine-D-alanine ligase